MYKWSQIGHAKKRNGCWIVSAAGRWYGNRSMYRRTTCIVKAEEDRAAEPLRQVEMLGLDSLQGCGVRPTRLTLPMTRMRALVKASTKA